jgi:hypothetical protein
LIYSIVEIFYNKNVSARMDARIAGEWIGEISVQKRQGRPYKTRQAMTPSAGADCLGGEYRNG